MDDLVINQQSFMKEMANMNRNDSEVRLPRVNIPIFAGEYSDFPSFKDLFEATIHNNNKIHGVHKLQYLKGLLRGDAAALVSHLQTTEKNYSEAWQKICQRYDKKGHVVNTLITKFISQPVLHSTTAKGLRALTDTSDEVIRGLKVLGPTAETRDPWVIHILSNKLDGSTKEAWANEATKTDFPTLESFFQFLNKRSDILESLDIKPIKTVGQRRINAMYSQQVDIKCLMCEGEHYLSKCEDYLELSPDKRKEFIIKKKLCFNCLSSNHQSVICRSKFKCIECKRKHHSSIHMEQSKPLKQSLNTNTEVSEITTLCGTLRNKDTMNNHIALLPTAVVLVQDAYGFKHRCRLLLDSGSQCSLITESMVHRLHLARMKSNVNIMGLTPGSLVSRGKARIKVHSKYNEDEHFEIEPLIVKTLPAKLPKASVNTDGRIFHGFELADDDFNQPAHIDLLLGADKFFDVIRDGQVRFADESCILQNTVFGWIVSGIIENCDEAAASSMTNFSVLNFHLDMDIDASLRRFWEIEEIANDGVLSHEDRACEEIYRNTTERKSNGRYVVRLPFNGDQRKIGNSFNTALKRFQSLERKLTTNEKLKIEYHEQLSEYLSQGHMKEVPREQLKMSDENIFYLPHHPVMKESSDTTKMRIVFDGSCKSTSGVSINDKLLVGPTIQPTLWNAILRFRSYRIALTADIEKMYRQVEVSEKDINYQRLLWRDKDGKIKHYQLTRVTFGLASSAFLAIRTLRQLAEEQQNEFPDIADRINHHFYVDDFISGCQTVDEARELKQNMKTVMKGSGFELRKWRSNLTELRDSEKINTDRPFVDVDGIKVLGIQWFPDEDVFSFKVRDSDEQPITKRKLLSETSQIFDPLGWVSPSIIILKTLFQKLWYLKLNWDDTLPSELVDIYNKTRSEFQHFEQIKIPRFVHSNDDSMELHGFCDASEKAYGAVIYSRSRDERGETIVSLLVSKTKVAPTKLITLPRLELCGALLLAKLMNSVRSVFKDSVKCFAWTDSQVVLAWLSAHPSKWKTFVANRTNEIQDRLPRNHWNYVRSSDNPADHASRGIYPSQLVKCKLWWFGPEWLAMESKDWPASKNEFESSRGDIDRETRKAAMNAAVLYTDIEETLLTNLLERFSSLNKFERVLAYVLRFIKNVKEKQRDERRTEELSCDEIANVRVIVLRRIQADTYDSDIKSLQHSRYVNNRSKLLSLTPFIDESGILRVGGRLKHAAGTIEFKCPAIIPANHRFTQLLIRGYHQRYLHAGATLVSNLLRHRYWIVQGRSRIRNELKNCVECVRHSAKTTEQIMGHLPSVRITPARPFSNCGIDFAGPISLLTKRGRGAKLTKGYICLFVCMATGAVFIEPVSDLTSQSFIASMKRFAARRGVPKNIYTDNGRNFVGAKRILAEAYDLIKNIHRNSIISEYLRDSEISWHFIPPSAPHFGGIWESAIKSVKTHLLKATKNINLTFEEMYV